MKEIEKYKKVAIFGSRDINKQQAESFLSAQIDVENCLYITSGNIKGVANIAQNIIKKAGGVSLLFNYEAGTGGYNAINAIIKKNKNMVKLCDEAIVIWNGESAGTAREIEMLKKAGKKYTLYQAEKADPFDFDFSI